MSYVTNVMLHYGLEDMHRLGEINAATAPLNNGQEFRDICGAIDQEEGTRWGGNKFPEVELVAAAFNYWDQDATMTALAAITWKRPDLVQLFICDQEDDAFSLYTITDADGEVAKFMRVYDGRDL